jgi:alginate O-acetyltransferase complex protein AlgI
MLFNSLEFLFLFLPVALIGYYALIYFGLKRWIFLFLVLVSLVFYGVWNPPYTILLIASVAGNYLFALLIEWQRTRNHRLGWSLTLGVCANLAVLGWYKYAGFFVTNVNAVAGTNWTLDHIILPLAISFYTFQQIAFLVDVARDEVHPGGIWRYTTFVIFFPQLIAGPIVHYRDMMPQFFGRNLGRFWRANMVVGLAIFAIGLFKKTVIADTAALFSSPIFNAVHAGDHVGLLAGWRAGMGYTIQLYFDFSGYSDMAVGLARMFGIILPVNFHSPLRARSIIDYWRRWHITLQQFIVSYMYQPLVLPLARSAGRRGYEKWGNFTMSVALPTVVIFIVIGLWHGAAWTFVLFGLMHGIFLATNEFWRVWRRHARHKRSSAVSIFACHALTLFCVMLANVMFRAQNPSDAVTIWRALFRFDELGRLPEVMPVTAAEWVTKPLLFFVFASALVIFMPNTQQLLGRYRPVLRWERWRTVAPPILHFVWRPTFLWAFWTGIVLFLGVAFTQRGQTEFIYFNF